MEHTHKNKNGTRREENKVGFIKLGLNTFGVGRRPDRITVDEDHECIPQTGPVMMSISFV